MEDDECVEVVCLAWDWLALWVLEAFGGSFVVRFVVFVIVVVIVIAIAVVVGDVGGVASLAGGG